MSSRVKEYSGTEITAEEARAGRYLLEVHETELKYAWSSGRAVSRFLEGLRDGEIWGRRCARCGRTMVPPRMYCEVCFRPTDEWVRLQDTGRVVTYSVSYVNADASRREGEQPILVAVVEVDGASPNMGILHVLGGFSPEELAVGARVKAVWKPKGDRTGAITDIVHFRPLGGEEEGP